jgi:hypothetical protein
MPESQLQPYQLRLVVNRNDDGYTASWIAADDQETELFPLILPLTEDDAERLRWYLETHLHFLGAAAARAGRPVPTRDRGRAAHPPMPVGLPPEVAEILDSLAQAVGA